MERESETDWSNWTIIIILAYLAWHYHDQRDSARKQLADTRQRTVELRTNVDRLQTEDWKDVIPDIQTSASNLQTEPNHDDDDTSGKN